MVNLAQQVEHRSVDSKDLVQVQSFTLLYLYIGELYTPKIVLCKIISKS